MATQISATTPRTQPAPRIGVLKVAILIVMALAVIGVGVWSQAGSVAMPVSTVNPASYHGPGLPLQGGFAGASRVTPVSTVDPARYHGTGLPLQGGFAGASRVDGGE